MQTLIIFVALMIFGLMTLAGLINKFEEVNTYGEGEEEYSTFINSD